MFDCARFVVNRASVRKLIALESSKRMNNLVRLIAKILD